MADVKQVIRKRGRPKKLKPDGSDNTLLTREAVVDRAYILSETVKLDDLSIERLARELNVSSTTIRHHIGSREAFISMMLARYFKDVYDRLPEQSDDWRANVRGFLLAHASMNLRKRGFVPFLFEHRFAPILQVAPEDAHYPNLVHKYSLDMLRASGLSTANAALAFHLLIHITLSITYADVKGQTPNQQADMMEMALAKSSDPVIDYSLTAALRSVTLPLLLETVTELLLDAIERKFELGVGT